MICSCISPSEKTGLSHRAPWTLDVDFFCFLQECEALGLESPHFTTLDDVAADISTTAASWAQYGDFLKERDELAHKDWLSMRDQVRQRGLLSLPSMKGF